MAVDPERPRRVPRLPRGRLDIVRQIALFAGAYALYELVRGLAGSSARRAQIDARHVISLERSLHVFAEPRIEHALQVHAEWVTDVASWIYVNANITVTAAVLVVVYLRWNDTYNCVRNAFLVAMTVALVGYTVFPTAPPRLMPAAYGFTDPVARLTGVTATHGLGGVLFNPYAAIPSMHVCFAVLIGTTLARLTRLRILSVLWSLYPALIVFVVLVTGNHYFTDVALGVLTALASQLAATQLLARAWPANWAFAGVPA